MRSLSKLFTLLFFLGAAMFPVYAFASSSSGPQAFGEGASPISGWTVSDVQYQLAADPSFVRGVTFQLDAPAQSVAVRVSSSSAGYTSCFNVQGLLWQCDFPAGIPIASMDELRVTAVGN